MAHHHAPPNLEDVVEALRQQGLRVTTARRQVVSSLLEAGHPVSIECLHQRLGAASFDLVTLYRNLDAFVEAGVAQVVRNESGKALYEIIGGPRDHHHHVICRRCGKIDCLDECDGDVARFENAARKLGYADLSHRLEIYGLCGDCRSK